MTKFSGPSVVMLKGFHSISYKIMICSLLRTDNSHRQNINICTFLCQVKVSCCLHTMLKVTTGMLGLTIASTSPTVLELVKNDNLQFCLFSSYVTSSVSCPTAYPVLSQGSGFFLHPFLSPSPHVQEVVLGYHHRHHQSIDPYLQDLSVDN